MANMNTNRNNSLIVGIAVIFTLLLVIFASSVIFTPQSKPIISNEAKISPALASSIMRDSSGQTRVLITTETGDYSTIVRSILEMGGTVSVTFKYTNGLAATVPTSRIQDLSMIPGIIGISIDVERTISSSSASNFLPEGARNVVDSYVSDEGIPLASNYQTVSLTPAEAAGYAPSNYNLGNVMDNDGVLASGNYGQDTLAVIIDTGVYADHFLLAGRVIGGVDISTDVGTPLEGATVSTNYYHGTHVAGILAGSGGILLPNTDSLAQSIEYYSGESLPAYDANNKILMLNGVAPASSIYSIKVFPASGAGASESTIIAAIEIAIDLKLVDGLDVDIISMSLGGWTGFDGRDMEDQVVDKATLAGITVVAAASNDGPYSGTIASPGTAESAITVGAVASPLNTRVFWDQNFGFLGIGDYLYPSDENQVIYFSSRGPTSDGRDKPTVSALGVFVLSGFTGSPGALGWASGTSMATPAIAGIVSLLNTWGESQGATPHDYKEAIEEGSTPIDGYDEYDQGAGLTSADSAMMALQEEFEEEDDHDDEKDDDDDETSEELEELFEFYSEFSPRHSRPKGEKISQVYGENGYSFDITLEPGFANDYWFKVDPDVERITIEVSNVDYGFDPIGFNSLEVYFQSGLSGTNLAHVDSTNVWGDATFVIEEYSTTASGYVFGAFLEDMPINPGYAKLVLENDWTSYDTFTATVNVKVERDPLWNTGNSDEFYNGMLADGDELGFFPVGFGANGVRLDLSWTHDYFSYPVADMDLIIAWFDTDGNLNWDYSGATLNSPEVVIINANNVAAVYVIVSAYGTYGLIEPWELDVTYL